jgi:hypothetical protein
VTASKESGHDQHPEEDLSCAWEGATAKSANNPITAMTKDNLPTFILLPPAHAKRLMGRGFSHEIRCMPAMGFAS